jgi:hypothetical protein
VTADPLAGGFESSQKKKRPTSGASFNSDTAGLVMANPLANLKADFQSLKADFESLIITNFKSQLDRKNERQPSARTNALRPNWSMNRTGRKVPARCGLQGTCPQSSPPPQSQSEQQTPLQLTINLKATIPLSSSQLASSLVPV